MYTKPSCPYCVKAAGILDSLDISYKTLNVAESPEHLKEMLEKSGGRKTVPQIFINGTHVGGCDDLEELYLAGSLPNLLAK